MNISNAIVAIEQARNSRVLVLAASNLDLDILPPLYDTLGTIGRVRRLDVVISCRGGVASAARRIALLMHEFTDHLSFIVPDRCESSGTIAALAAREIIAGPVAVFSPVDPLLQAASSATDGVGAISAQDIRLFGTMVRDWFALSETEASGNAVKVLCDNIFPPSLTAFYRSTLEIEAICQELLALHLPLEPREIITRVVQSLLFGYHSHGFPLSGSDLCAIGLPVRSDSTIEKLAWEIAGKLRASVGGPTRRQLDEDWFDSLLATRSGAIRRRRSQGALNSVWEKPESE